MDIAFHYFAVKTLARLAGFGENDAQIIAQNSQMVDDFDLTSYWRCTNVPAYIKSNDDYDLCVSFGFFNPAQTGFLCEGMLGYTDYVNLATSRFQKYTCTPFHFIPPGESMIGEKEYRVTPAVLGDGSIISQLLEQAKEDYLAVKDEKVRHRELMRLGILLHIFADTVAHQMFSGFNAYVNLVELVSVTNNITGRDVTADYKSYIQKSLKLLKDWVPGITPAIGHMMLEHVPDLTHLTFTMEYNDGGVQRYTRNNTDAFIEMSKHILNFLRACLGLSKYEEERWQDIEEKLRKAFLTDISADKDQKQTVNYLREVWTDAFGSTYLYDYDGERLKKMFARGNAAAKTIAPANVDGIGEISLDYQPSAADMKLSGMDMGVGGENTELNSILSTEASNDFYDFNVIADEILIKLYGPHPRRL